MEPQSADNDQPIQVELDGKTYKLSRLDGADISDMDAWVRRRIIQDAAAAILPNDAEQIQRLVLESAVKTAASASWLTSRSVLENLDGISQLIWISLRRNHRELRAENVRTMLMKQGAVDLAMQAFSAQNPNLVG